jgi:hypothetical protein
MPRESNRCPPDLSFHRHCTRSAAATRGCSGRRRSGIRRCTCLAPAVPSSSRARSAALPRRAQVRAEQVKSLVQTDSFRIDLSRAPQRLPQLGARPVGPICFATAALCLVHSRAVLSTLAQMAFEPNSCSLWFCRAHERDWVCTNGAIGRAAVHRVGALGAAAGYGDGSYLSVGCATRLCGRLAPPSRSGSSQL